MKDGQSVFSLALPVIAVFALVFLAAAKLNDSTRIGVVDLNQVFEGCAKKERLEEDIAEAMAPANKTLKTLEKKINTAKEDLLLLAKGTTRYDELEKQLFGFMQEAVFEQSKANQRLAQLSLQSRDTLVREIKGTVRSYGRDNGYTVILQREFTLPKETNTWQAVIYQDDTADLTQTILKILNSG